MVRCWVDEFKAWRVANGETLPVEDADLAKNILLEWLKTYTFPSEAKFADLGFAARVCHSAVARTLLHGTTSCMYFATIHTDAAVQPGHDGINIDELLV